MKTIVKIIISLFILTSSQLQSQTTNYSDSVSDLIELIKTKLNSSDSLSIKIEFINRHRGEYKINSTIKVSNQNISLYSHINDMLNEDSDVVFSFSKSEFEKELNSQLKILSEYKDQLVIGGNYQDVIVYHNNDTKKFKTRKALALMNLFDSGGLKYKTE